MGYGNPLKQKEARENMIMLLLVLLETAHAKINKWNCRGVDISVSYELFRNIKKFIGLKGSPHHIHLETGISVLKKYKLSGNRIICRPKPPEGKHMKFGAKHKRIDLSRLIWKCEPNVNGLDFAVKKARVRKIESWALDHPEQAIKQPR